MQHPSGPSRGRITSLLCALIFAATAQAGDDFVNLKNIGQQNFKLISQDMGAALSYKSLSPAEPLGIAGFDLGLELSNTTLKNDAAFDFAAGGDGLGYLPVPKLHAHKGLPANIDVGFMYSQVPSTDIRLTGLEARYALVAGNVALPAVAVRGTYSSLEGIDEFEMETTGLELTVSKGFLMLTPYAGMGNVWVDSTPTGTAATTGLKKEELSLDKWFIGANFNMGLINMAVEMDDTGGTRTLGGKLGVRF